jgi:hypothetical protein
MTPTLSPSELADQLDGVALVFGHKKPAAAEICRAAALALREREAEWRRAAEAECAMLVRIRQLEEALRKLLARFIACARSNGNSDETINYATAEARDALAPSPQEPK